MQVGGQSRWALGPSGQSPRNVLNGGGDEVLLPLGLGYFALSAAESWLLVTGLSAVAEADSYVPLQCWVAAQLPSSL